MLSEISQLLKNFAMARLTVFCVALLVCLVGVYSAPQFGGFSQANAQAGSFGGGPGFQRPYGPPGPPGYGSGVGGPFGRRFGNRGGNTNISISKSISISRGGAGGGAQSSSQAGSFGK